MAFTNRQKIITSSVVVLLLILTCSTVALSSVEQGFFSRLKNWAQLKIIKQDEPTDYPSVRPNLTIMAPEDPLQQQYKETQQKPMLTISSWDQAESSIKKENDLKSENYDNIEKPKPASPIEITYPLKARRLGWEGTTSLEVLISPTGQIEGIKIISGSGYEILDEAAVKSINATKFIPGSSTLPMKLTCSVKFSLK